MKAIFHLPGLFEFYDFYKIFLPLYYEHQEYFYDWCKIGSIYGAPAHCIWGGGRTGFGQQDADSVFNLLEKYGISARLTFSNSLLKQEHLSDKKCNSLCSLFSKSKNPTGIIIYSDLLLSYLQEKFPAFYFVSSTTKVITAFDDFEKELNRLEFAYVVPDFRFNKKFDRLEMLSQGQKNKIEFLCNECCDFNCTRRKLCYENVSQKALGENCVDHQCFSPDAGKGYRFSAAMKNPGFIGIYDIQEKYLPLGFTNFKVEGRSLGSAIILEFLLYYLTKPEYHLQVREAVYLDSSLDLF